MEPLSVSTVYFSIAALLLLSIATISLCKADKTPIRSYREFLFSGKTYFHSLVSSAGAIFSVTYLLGATFIYASIYRAWTFVMALLVGGFSFVVIRRVIRVALLELPADLSLGRRDNLLLAFMRKRLSQDNFRVFSGLLSLAFFLLLVEELAISRVVLRSAVPGSKPLADLLLFIITCVVLAYLYIGGFRAVLNSDLIQSIVLVLFMSVLAIIVASRKDALPALVMPAIVTPSHLISAVLLWSAYGTCFLVVAVDLFSRLNFSLHGGQPELLLVRFAGLSLLLVVVIASVGIAFGLAISADLGDLRSASYYYDWVVSFFVGAGAEQARVVFLVALFCMIFTTLDTLLITTMQVRWYTARFGSRQSEIPSVLLLAVALAVPVPADAVCAFGIYVGSIMILPAMQLLQQVYPALRLPLAGDHRFLWLAFLMSTVGCVVLSDRLIYEFELQHAIPGFFVAGAFAASIAWSAVVSLRRF